MLTFPMLCSSLAARLQCLHTIHLICHVSSPGKPVNSCAHSWRRLAAGETLPSPLWETGIGRFYKYPDNWCVNGMIYGLLQNGRYFGASSLNSLCLMTWLLYIRPGIIKQCDELVLLTRLSLHSALLDKCHPLNGVDCTPSAGLQV